MAKFRIIPSLLFKDHSVVKGINFENHRAVGDLTSTINVFSNRQADEMIIHDINAYSNKKLSESLIHSAVKNCNMPLTLGGGIRKIDEAKYLFDNGSDKISVNTLIYENHKIIEELSKIYGSQSIVASIDLKYDKIKSEYYIFTNNGKKKIKKFIPDIEISFLKSIGIGEIIFTSIDKEGTLSGIDRKLVQILSDLTEIPCIIAGGCNSWQDIKFCYEHNLSGIAASSIFFWEGESTISLKKNLILNQVNVREVI